MNSLKKTKRQMIAERTRSEIFDATLRLLGEKEFSTITVRDIVKEANVSIGSFYHSYPSKLDVFYKTCIEEDRYFETVVFPEGMKKPVEDRISYFFDEYAQLNSARSSFALTKVLYNPENTNFHRSDDFGIVHVLVEFVRQAKEAGILASDETAAQTAQFLMICARGIVYDWCTCNASYDLGIRMPEYIGRLLRSC